jgi:hypothetical protein
MEKTRLIGLERLVRLCGRFGPQGIEIAHAMAAQAAIQTRARNIGVEKLARHRQQVIQRQQQHPAQLDHNGFLWACKRRRQLKCCMRAILKAGSTPPAINGVERHPVARGKHRRRLFAGRDFRPDRWGRRRVLVQR